MRESEIERERGSDELREFDWQSKKLGWSESFCFHDMENLPSERETSKRLSLSYLLALHIIKWTEDFIWLSKIRKLFKCF